MSRAGFELSYTARRAMRSAAIQPDIPADNTSTTLGAPGLLDPLKQDNPEDSHRRSYTDDYGPDGTHCFLHDALPVNKVEGEVRLELTANRFKACCSTD